MANDLSAVVNKFYTAAEVVGRELVGAIPGCTINADPAERIAIGETITSIYTPEPVVNKTYVPSMTIPEGDNQTLTAKTMTVSQVANIRIPWTGEEMRKVENGPGFGVIYDNQIAKALRSLTNDIESYVCATLMNSASRWYGTAGTAPFATNFNELPELRKILVDNGVPFNGGVTCVINTRAGANLRKLAQLQKANEAGETTLLRQGVLLDLMGFMLKESAGISTHTKGTGAGYLVNNASGLAVKDTAIPVDTGTGTILAGDVVTFTGDTEHLYGVNTALSANSLTLNDPGIMAEVADNTALTVGGSYTGNIAFHQNAIELVCRPPAQPTGGDAAADRTTVQDPVSGLVYEFALYKGYGKQMLDITTFYDAKVWNPMFVAGLLG